MQGRTQNNKYLQVSSCEDNFSNFFCVEFVSLFSFSISLELLRLKELKEEEEEVGEEGGEVLDSVACLIFLAVLEDLYKCLKL